jgi:hypothetical protein
VWAVVDEVRRAVVAEALRDAWALLDMLFGLLVWCVAAGWVAAGCWDDGAPAEPVWAQALAGASRTATPISKVNLTKSRFIMPSLKTANIPASVNRV